MLLKSAVERDYSLKNNPRSIFAHVFLALLQSPFKVNTFSPSANGL